MFIGFALIVLLVLGFMYKKYRIAPDIQFHQLSLTDLDKNVVNFQDYAGKNIFVTMWAPWCRDCLVEMPDLQYLKNQLTEDKFVFLAISGFDIVKEKAYADKMPYDFTYLHMRQKLKEIGIHALPTNYIVNSKGKIVYEKVGAEADWKSDETINKIRELVK